MSIVLMQSPLPPFLVSIQLGIMLGSMSVAYVYMYSPPDSTPPPPPPLPQESPTLVDDEAVLGEIVSGEYPLIGPQHEQNLGRVLSDVVYTRFVSQIKSCHLTGHLKKKQGYLVKCFLKNTQ